MNKAFSKKYFIQKIKKLLIFNNKNINSAYKIFLCLTLIFSLSGTLLIFVSNNNLINTCNEAVSIKNQNIKSVENKVYSPRDITLKNFKNIACLGKIIEGLDTENLSDDNLYYGTNLKLYNIFSIIFNFLLISFLFFDVINVLSGRYNYLKILFNFLILNYFLYITFLSFENFLEYIYSIKIFIEIFLVLISIKFFKDYGIILLFTFFLFFDYEGSIIFVIFYFIKNSLNFEFSNKAQNIFITLPFIFYFLRFLSGIINSLDLIWYQLSQNIYQIPTKFNDIKTVLYIHKCNADTELTKFSNIDGDIFICNIDYVTGYGPLLSRIPLKFSLLTTFYIVLVLIFVFLFLLYSKSLKLYPGKKDLIVILMVSPPMNMALERMNIDILILMIAIFLLSNFEKNQYLSTLILFIMSIYKVHPIGLLIGIFIVFLKNKNFKESITVFFTNLIFLILIIYDFFEYSNIPSVEPNLSLWRYIFGLLFDFRILINLLHYSNLNNFYIFSLILFLIVLISYFLRNKIYFKKEIFTNPILIIPLITWSALCIVYINFSYRSIIFIAVFLLLFENSSKFTKLLFINSIFLKPISFNTEFYNYKILKSLEYFLSFIHSLSNLFIFIILLSILFNYLIINTKEKNEN